MAVEMVVVVVVVVTVLVLGAVADVLLLVMLASCCSCCCWFGESLMVQLSVLPLPLITFLAAIAFEKQQQRKFGGSDDGGVFCKCVPLDFASTRRNSTRPGALEIVAGTNHRELEMLRCNQAWSLYLHARKVIGDCSDM